MKVLRTEVKLLNLINGIIIIIKMSMKRVAKNTYNDNIAIIMKKQ